MRKYFFLLLLIAINLASVSAQGVWNKTFDLGDDSRFESVQQLSDGGYIAAGYLKLGNQKQGVLVRTNANGGTCAVNASWECTGSGTFVRNFGGNLLDDYFYHVEQTSDGGYLSVGYTYTFTSGGDMEIWLIKTDANGSTCDWSGDGECNSIGAGGVSIFSKLFGNSDGSFRSDEAQFAQEILNSSGQTEGYFIAGHTHRFGGGFSEHDFWLIKTNETGDTCSFGDDDNCEDLANGMFAKTVDWPGDGEYLSSAARTSDGGFILVGEAGHALNSAWVVKTDANGDTCTINATGECSGTGANNSIVFAKMFGKSGSFQSLSSVQETLDFGYIFAGVEIGYGQASNNAWVIKTNSSGDTCDYSFSGTCSDVSKETFVKIFRPDSGASSFASVKLAPNNSYVLVGSSWMVKINKTGDACNFNPAGICVDAEEELFATIFNDSSLFDVFPADDYGYIAAGSINGSALLFKTDSLGNVSKQNTGTPENNETNFSITLISPAEGDVYSTNESLQLNFSIIDSGGNLDSCWYNINNKLNVSIVLCQNTTFNVSADGNYVIGIYANESTGNLSFDSANFSVDTLPLDNIGGGDDGGGGGGGRNDRQSITNVTNHSLNESRETNNSQSFAPGSGGSPEEGAGESQNEKSGDIEKKPGLTGLSILDDNKGRLTILGVVVIVVAVSFISYKIIKKFRKKV